ncbi:MAG: CHASE domain-containing protein [Methylovulum sp.]|nr:CHASE domain-containing protein [Methylovulum sp.]
MTIFHQKHHVRPATPRLAPYLLTGAVLLGGLGISAVLWRHAQQQDASYLHTTFAAAANMTTINISHRFDSYAIIMRGVQGFLGRSEHLSHADFSAYVQALHLPKQAGVQAIGFAQKITDAEKSEHASTMRQQGFPQYQISPKGQRDDYAPITYIEPFSEENLSAFGFDPLTVPAARLAMEQSRDSGDIRITPKINLIQDTGRPSIFGFVMYLPLYKKDAAVETLAERRTAIIGWVDVPFRINDLMTGLHGELPPDIHLEIYDGAVSEQTRMFSSGVVSQAAGILQTRRPLEVGGRQWTLLMRSTPAFENNLPSLHPPILIASLSGFLSLILGLLVWQVSRGQQTADLHFRKLFDQAGEGILTLASNHRILDANNAALALLGYTQQELLSLQVHDIIAARELPRLDASVKKMMAGEPHLEQWVLLRKDGAEITVEVSARRLDNDCYFAVLRDQTEHQKATQRILRLTKLYQALSQTNQAIVRMDGIDALLPLVCRCAVDLGGMNMAWVGQLNPTNSLIEANTAYGVGQAYLKDLILSSNANVPEGQGPSGTALRENRPVIINNYLTDPMTRLWHGRAKQFNWGSAATFPIQRSNKPFALLTVYHEQIDIFDTETINLLKEMTTDISFALDNFDHETQRKQAEEKLQQQLKELQQWYEVTLGREKRVMELKSEINQLRVRLGEPPCYATQGDNSAPDTEVL